MSGAKDVTGYSSSSSTNPGYSVAYTACTANACLIRGVHPSHTIHPSWNMSTPLSSTSTSTSSSSVLTSSSSSADLPIPLTPASTSTPSNLFDAFNADQQRVYNENAERVERQRRSRGEMQQQRAMEMMAASSTPIRAINIRGRGGNMRQIPRAVDFQYPSQHASQSRQMTAMGTTRVTAGRETSTGNSTTSSARRVLFADTDSVMTTSSSATPAYSNGSAIVVPAFVRDPPYVPPTPLGITTTTTSSFKRKVELEFENYKADLEKKKARLEEQHRRLVNELGNCAKEIDQVQQEIKSITMTDWLKRLFPELIPSSVKEVTIEEKQEECGVCFDKFRTEELVICSANCAGRLCVPCSSRIRRDENEDYRCPFCRAGLWSPIDNLTPTSESDDDDDEDEEVDLSGREELLSSIEANREAVLNYRQAIEDTDNSPGL